MYEYSAKLKRVVDGDTVDLLIDLGFNVWIQHRVRLWGINTPETRTRDKEEKIRGLAAKKYLRELLRGSSSLVLRTEKEKKGKYGRILGIIVCEVLDAEGNLDELTVNDQLIKEGHAVEYFGGKR
jgi:micrococcal nuclease